MIDQPIRKEHTPEELRRMREIAQMVKIAGQVAKPKPRWSPQNATTRQKIASECDSREILYGGAAGGGKSSWLLMEALRYVDIPGYAALLLRRTYADLSKPGALIDRSKQWLTPTKASWNEQRKQWTFPSGATITFGYLENENDKYQYQGSELQFIGFDELTQFTETQYTYLFSRLRRLAGVEIPIRMRAATNPGGSGAEWVKKRFIPDGFEPSHASEDRVFWKDGIDTDGRVTRRAFVPARIEDNPHLDQAEYDESLAELDTVTREQLKHGDWSISAQGDIYWMFDPKYVFISWSQWERVYGVRHIPHHWFLTLSQDQGTTAGHIGATGWFATAAENSPLPGLVAMYRAFQNVKMSASDLGDMMLTYMGDRPKATELVNTGLVPDGLGGIGEKSRLLYLLNSHEAESERLEYAKMGLYFGSWTAGPDIGLAQMRNYLTIIDRDKPNPFNPELMGRTRFVCVVPDEDYPRRRSGSVWARVEAEFLAYHYKIAKSGESLAKPIPDPFFNDFMDCIKQASFDAFPPIKALTPDEQREKSLPVPLKNETLAKAMRDETVTPEHVAAVYLARQFEMAQQPKQDSGSWVNKLLG